MIPPPPTSTLFPYTTLFRSLPNNAELSPASLNDWLNAQPDGYLGEGAINWLAVSRLTQQMAKTLRTPKLEYRKLAGDEDRKSTRLNSSHSQISYAVFCLKKK